LYASSAVNEQKLFNSASKPLGNLAAAAVDVNFDEPAPSEEGAK